MQNRKEQQLQKRKSEAENRINNKKIAVNTRPSHTNIQIASINANGAGAIFRDELLVYIYKNPATDIILIQETKFNIATNIQQWQNLVEWNFTHIPYNTDLQCKQGGLALLTKKNLTTPELLWTHHGTAQAAQWKITAPGLQETIQITNIYRKPYNPAADMDTTHTYNKNSMIEIAHILQQARQTTPHDHATILIAGDLNAKIGRAQQSNQFNHLEPLHTYSEKQHEITFSKINKSTGGTLLETLNEKRLAIITGRINKSKQPNHTYQASEARGNTKSAIDYIITPLHQYGNVKYQNTTMEHRQMMHTDHAILQVGLSLLASHNTEGTTPHLKFPTRFRIPTKGLSAPHPQADENTTKFKNNLKQTVPHALDQMEKIRQKLIQYQTKPQDPSRQAQQTQQDLIDQAYEIYKDTIINAAPEQPEPTHTNNQRKQHTKRNHKPSHKNKQYIQTAIRKRSQIQQEIKNAQQQQPSTKKNKIIRQLNKEHQVQQTNIKQLIQQTAYATQTEEFHDINLRGENSATAWQKIKTMKQLQQNIHGIPAITLKED